MEVASERAVAAAVLGALIPELQYATALLLERYERGEPLLRRTPPSDPGFEGRAVDPILLEFFKAIVPHVRASSSAGARSACCRCGTGRCGAITPR